MKNHFSAVAGGSPRQVRRNGQRGVTSIEYALIASLIALAIIAGLSATGDANALSWNVWAEKVVAALGG